MLFQIFQFAAIDINTPLDITNNSTFSLYIAVFVFLIILALLFLLRAFLIYYLKIHKTFDRIVLQIAVPKERKSEGQEGQVGQDDRLEQVKEEIGITETFFSALSGLRPKSGFVKWLKGRDDHFSFEIVSQKNLIYFYIETNKKMHNFIEQQIHAQYPHAQIEEMTDYNIFSEKSKITGAYLEARVKNVFPFKTYKKMESDPLSSVLNVFSAIKEGNDALAVQFIVRSADKKWRRKGIYLVREVKKGKKFENIVHRSTFGKYYYKFMDNLEQATKKKEDIEKTKQSYQLSPMEEEMIKGVEEKLSKGAMEVTIRLLSVSDDDNMAKIHLDNLINSFNQFNLYRYGNTFEAKIPRKQTSIIRDFIFRSFNEERKSLLSTEEMAGLWHLPLHSTEAPSIKWLQGRRAPPPANLPKDGLLLGHIPYRGTDTKVFIKDADRRRHLYTIGKSGSGKSVFIQNLAVQDIKNGKGVAILDPHGDFAEYVLEHVPKERADDVVVFNPSDFERPIGLNMLEAKTEDQKDFAVQEMIAIFYKLFPPEMIGPMFEHSMRNVMLTLMADVNDPGTIIDIPRMFTDNDYVKKYLRKVKDPLVRAYWEKEIAQTSDFHKSEMLGYLISKVGRFVENEMMRNIMGQQQSGFNFRDIMDNQKILIVNLAKGTTGEMNSKLLGLIIVSKLQMAAMGRADMPEEQRKDFYLYIDEFQNYCTDSIATILSEARKYRLCLVIAHQYLAQLVDDKGKTDVRDAVLGNAGTMCSFRIGPDDSEILAKEFAPVFGAYDLLNVPMFSSYTKLLIDNTASKPFCMSGYPPIKGNRDLAGAIKQLSRLKFGRDKDIVESEIIERTKLGPSESQAKTDMFEATL